jgi:hypothetical protein
LSNSWRRISSINAQPSWHGQTRFQAFSSSLAAAVRGSDEKEQIDGAKPHPVSGSAADLQSDSAHPFRAPHPISDFGQVLAVQVDVAFVLDQLVPALPTRLIDPKDHLHDQRYREPAYANTQSALKSKALSQRRCGNKVTLPGYQQFH